MSSRPLQFVLLTLNLASLSFCWQEGKYYAPDGPGVSNSPPDYIRDDIPYPYDDLPKINLRETNDIVVGTVYFVIAVAAFILNLMSAFSLYTSERLVIKRTQMILLNLVCLLLVPTMLGTALDRVNGGWNFGILACKFSNWFKIFCISMQTFLCLLIIDHANSDVIPNAIAIKKKLGEQKLKRYVAISQSVKFLIVFALSFALACPVWNRSDVSTMYGRSQCIVKVYDEPEQSLEEYDYSYQGPTVLGGYDEGGIEGENPVDDESYEASGAYDLSKAYNDVFADYMEEGIYDLEKCGMAMASPSYKLWFLYTSFASYFVPLLSVLLLTVAMTIKLRTCEAFKFNRMVVLFLTSALCLAPINAYKLSTYFGVDLDRDNCALFGLIASVVAHLSTVLLPLVLVFHACRARKERGEEYDRVSEEKKALTSRSDEFLA